MNATKRWSLIWLIVVPVVIGTVAGFVVSWRTPPRYRSQATIMVVPPRVPADLVPTPPIGNLSQRINAIEQTIRTRSRTERLITDFNLFEAERKTMIMQDVVELFQKNVDVRVEGNSGRGDNTFVVAYTGSDPKTVQKVAERLATMFIDESYRQGSQRAEGTLSYVVSLIDDAARRIDDQQKGGGVEKQSRRAKLESESLDATYVKLLGELQKARMTASLESKQLGEQFNLIDPPRIPEKPINPTRGQAAATGAIGGLALGLVLALFAGISRLLAERRAAGDSVRAESI